MKIINVSSMVGMNTGLPLVRIEFGSEDVQVQPHEARALALNLLSAADASESDWALYRFLTETVGTKDADARATLGEMREFRARRPSVPGSEPS